MQKRRDIFLQLLDRRQILILAVGSTKVKIFHKENAINSSNSDG